MKRRIHIRYKGRVQGVGFRFTVCNIAADLAVTGFVRNEIEGSVLLVAEGEDADLQSLMQNIRSSRIGRFVIDEQVRWDTPNEEFECFGVRY